MTPIELRPHAGGPAITGTWNAQGLLYLIGHGGALQWSAEVTDGALPLAVAFRCRDSVTIAPVHPMCHFTNASTTIRLGTEIFDIHATASKWRRPVRAAVMAGVMIAALACGWWLHTLAASASPVVIPSQEEMYVF